jgi:peptide methionine sulfoxide reductase MsrA
MKIDASMVEYVFECMKKNPTKIRNIKSYLKTALYNSVSTVDAYYAAEVNHDLYGQKNNKTAAAWNF